jgi:decaprenylphospho-beta-D-ribofuranose 2-oxidase
MAAVLETPRGLPTSAPHYVRRERISPLVGAGETESLVARPRTVHECREVLAYCESQGLSVCPRGSGHSYGDQALNDGQLLLDTTRMDRILAFDEQTGRMTCEPGVQILDVYKRAHPQLFVLPASPSEATITVAGAIANNVNGKDGWRVGNFGEQVVSLTLLLASGEIRHVDRDSEPKIFDAVIGGMGMLGVVVEATLQLERVDTPWLETRRVEAADVSSLLVKLEQAARDSDFAVAWVDVYSRRGRGRSVVHTTKWLRGHRDARESSRKISESLDRLAFGRHQALVFHERLFRLIAGLLRLQRLTVRTFNRLYFLFCAVRSRLAFVSPVELFIDYNFFPNLQIPPVAVVCGPRGYAVQIVIPRTRAEPAILEMIRICRHMPCPPVTTVLRLHRRDHHLLSFSEDGYSMNFEFHPTRRHEARMRESVDRLVECAIRYRGKVYLAKDAVLRPEQFRALFSGHAEFLRVKRQLDPRGRFSSDMFRRLFPEAAS